MNEELQSTNDELHTINDTLGERSVELDHARRFGNSLVDSIRFGMVVVDRDMRVVVWNRGCEAPPTTTALRAATRRQESSRDRPRSPFGGGVDAEFGQTDKGA